MSFFSVVKCRVLGERINREVLGNKRSEYGKKGFDEHKVLQLQIQRSLEIAKARFENAIFHGVLPGILICFCITRITLSKENRYTDGGWDYYEFNGGNRWNRIKKPERRAYQINAYRVLLTRARQGMIICVPEGNSDDTTRLPEFYDGTYHYLKSLGFFEL